jgi:hypothetical protein
MNANNGLSIALGHGGGGGGGGGGGRAKTWLVRLAFYR